MRVLPEPERDVFLAAIHAEPDDLMARLVYADWLDEAGHSDAELVRLLCEVKSSSYADCPASRRLSILAGGRDAPDLLAAGDQWLFACDCAERVLPLFERRYPDNDSPRLAIGVARRFEFLEADEDELDAAMAAADEARQVAGTDALEARQAWTSAWHRRRSGGEFDSIAFRSACRELTVAEYAAEAAATIGSGEAAKEVAHTASIASTAAADGVEVVARKTVWPIERRWQLCRAVEYRLGFVPLPFFDVQTSVTEL